MKKTLIVLLGLLPSMAVANALQAALARGDFPAALEQVDAQLQQQPGNLEARFHKGLILTMLDRLDEAAQVYRDLNRSAPQFPEPANNLAVVLARQGHFEEALGTLHELVRRHPEYAPAQENLGDVLTAAAEQAYMRARDMGAGHSTLLRKLTILESLNSLPGSRTAPADAPSPQPATRIDNKPSPVLPAGTDVRVEEAQREAVLQLIETWRNAWASGDIALYLSSYAEDFDPPMGQSRQNWEQQRKDRVSPDRAAQISLQEMELRFRSDDYAIADFRQDYSARSYADSVRKRLVLRRDGGWRIVREVVLP